VIFCIIYSTIQMPLRDPFGQVLGIIPARSGSQGVPHKNIRLLGGKPLLQYSAESAIQSGIFDRVILSTDSAEYAAIGEAAGAEVPFLRPAEISGGDIPIQTVLEYVVALLEKTGWKPSIIFLINPTCPFREPSHFVAALETMQRCECDSLVSVQPVPLCLCPHYVLRMEGGHMKPFLAEGAHIHRRQEVTPAYVRDGLIYAVHRDVLMDQHTLYGDNCIPLFFDVPDHVNIDSEEDWRHAERVVSARIPQTVTSSGVAGFPQH